MDIIKEKLWPHYFFIILGLLWLAVWFVFLFKNFVMWLFGTVIASTVITKMIIRARNPLTVIFDDNGITIVSRKNSIFIPKENVKEIGVLTLTVTTFEKGSIRKTSRTCYFINVKDKKKCSQRGMPLPIHDERQLMKIGGLPDTFDYLIPQCFGEGKFLKIAEKYYPGKIVRRKVAPPTISPIVLD